MRQGRRSEKRALRRRESENTPSLLSNSIFRDEARNLEEGYYTILSVGSKECLVQKACRKSGYFWLSCDSYVSKVLFKRTALTWRLELRRSG